MNEQEREEGALLKGSLKEDGSDNSGERSPRNFQTEEKKSIPSIESSEPEEDSQSEDSL